MTWPLAANIKGPAGPAGGGYSRTTTTVTTDSLAANATGTYSMVLAKAFILLAIQTSRVARVTVYENATARANDANRGVGTTPASNAGVVLDYVTPDTALRGLGPLVVGRNSESPVTTSIPIRVTNMGSTGTIDVTLTWLKVE